MIKVSYLVSYDYSMLLTSLKQLYKHVDKIVLSFDKEFKTWSGNKFLIPDSFFSELKSFDTKNKIELYFDNFYLAELSPMECESRQRNMTLQKLGRGWKIQLDVDEYIFNFEDVKKYLKTYRHLTFFPSLTPICLTGRLITLFKKVDEGFVFIDNSERFPFITNQNYNVHTRRNDKITNHFSNIMVIHQSWAREPEEIATKVKNWGHRDDFDTSAYLEFWNNVDVKNYLSQKNFHPLVPEVWNKLEFIASDSIDDFINKYSRLYRQSPIPISSKNQLKKAVKKLIGRK